MELAKIIVGATTGICLDRRRIPAGAVGLGVAVEFVDPIWEEMTKTVVFRGVGSRIAEFDGKTAIIPWEVLTEPGKRIYFGVYGRNPETGVQLPLIEVNIGITERSTDTEADPGADPTLPIWAQLQQDVEDLKENLDQQVEESIRDYLEKNPPSGGVQFETDATLKLENGVLSVNTTGDVEQDNTLPITSAGVFATVGNIEALLKTI